MEDARFAKFSTDPKYRTVPKKEKKVTIDGRFKSMFKEKGFVAKSNVDKRGRPTKFSTKENFRRYYNLDKDSDEDSDNEPACDDQGGEKEKRGSLDEQEEKVVVDQSPEKTVKSKIRNRLQDLTVDYARGEGDLDSSSSSSEEEESSEEDEVEEGKEDEVQFDKWGELDHDAERSGEVTRRLAVCNMDWDRVGSEDIFIAMSSFCPVGGHVRSVRVFVSEFGRKRLAEEDKLGPEELRGRGEQDPSSGDDDDEEVDGEQVDTRAMERVRRYQVNRLKYYYAVAEFDSPESANRVYEECDGTEYELSATRFDLRFIPDDMDFKIEEATTTCISMPDATKYKPKVFMTSALQQGKVDLTWDETDPNRLSAMKRAFDREDDDGDDVKAYLATDSEDESAANEEDREEQELSEDDSEDAIAKYKALLAEITSKEKKKEDEKGNMEVVFGATDAVRQEMEKKAVEKMSPWDQFLHKKKEKSAAKRDKRRQQNKKEDSGSSEEENQAAFSDDDIPGGFDFDDPFFQSELGQEDSVIEKKKKKSNKTKDKKQKGKVAEEEDPDGGELSLLVMDSDDDKGHFDYKEIVKKESKSKKKGKKRKQQENSNVSGQADFHLDLQDDRFAAVFENADFNVDPSHPSFKKTKSMQEVIAEKQRRILVADDNEHEQRGEPNKKKKQKVTDDAGTSSSPRGKKDGNSDLDGLVRAVKKKTSQKANRAKTTGYSEIKVKKRGKL